MRKVKMHDLSQSVHAGIRSAGAVNRDVIRIFAHLVDGSLKHRLHGSLIRLYLKTGKIGAVISKCNLVSSSH